MRDEIALCHRFRGLSGLVAVSTKTGNVIQEDLACDFLGARWQMNVYSTP